MKYETPEQIYARWLEREQVSRQPSEEEREVVKMCMWMSYLTDKAVTLLLKAIDGAWEASLAQHTPRWPRCYGGISFFVDLEPLEKKVDIGSYVFVDGKKGILTTKPTPIPWSAAWDLVWYRKRKQVEQVLSVQMEWFRSIEGIDREWPAKNEASYKQVFGVTAVAVISYAIKHGSFSGAVIGEDSFFPYGSWLRFDRKYTEEGVPTMLVFRKSNFKCRVRSELTAIEEEKLLMEQVARLLESQIIAYSLFGLDKFTILKVQADDQEFYLPAGRTSVGSYLVPIKYAVERVTGKRVVYDPKSKQMKVEVDGRKEMVKGELIEAANKYVQIPEEERIVTDWNTIRILLRLRKVQDIRFEQ